MEACDLLQQIRKGNRRGGMNDFSSMSQLDTTTASQTHVVYFENSRQEVGS